MRLLQQINRYYAKLNTTLNKILQISDMLELVPAVDAIDLSVTAGC